MKNLILHANRMVVTTKLDVLVASYGGCGTSFFMNFLNNYFNINSPHDRDRLKHTCIPPLTLSPKMKAIYIFGDPIKAVVSLFRRDYHAKHSLKIKSAIDGSPNFVSNETTLQEYSERSHSGFGFREHYYAWHEISTAYPILFVKYETMWENLDLIFNFLGLPLDLTQDFPQKKLRNSSLESLPQSVLNGLYKLHGSFSDEVKEKPNIEVIHNKLAYGIQLSVAPLSIVKNNQSFSAQLMLNSFFPKSYQTFREIIKSFSA